MKVLSRIYNLLEVAAAKQSKMALLVRADLKMSKGKTAAQCSHASILCYQRSQEVNEKTLQTWCVLGQPKIVLGVDSLDELLRIQSEAKKINLVARIVKDAGRTQLEPGTVTVLGLGPDKAEKIAQLVQHLKLL